MKIVRTSFIAMMLCAVTFLSACSGNDTTPLVTPSTVTVTVDKTAAPYVPRPANACKGAACDGKEVTDADVMCANNKGDTYLVIPETDVTIDKARGTLSLTKSIVTDCKGIYFARFRPYDGKTADKPANNAAFVVTIDVDGAKAYKPQESVSTNPTIAAYTVGAYVPRVGTTIKACVSSGGQQKCLASKSID